MSKKFKLLADRCGWPRGTIVTKCKKDPYSIPTLTLVECRTPGNWKHGPNGYDTQPDGMFVMAANGDTSNGH